MGRMNRQDTWRRIGCRITPRVQRGVMRHCGKPANRAARRRCDALPAVSTIQNQLSPAIHRMHSGVSGMTLVAPRLMREAAEEQTIAIKVLDYDGMADAFFPYDPTCLI